MRFQMYDGSLRDILITTAGGASDVKKEETPERDNRIEIIELL